MGWDRAKEAGRIGKGGMIMGQIQRNRWTLAIQVMGIVIAWAGNAFDKNSEDGGKVSKAEAVDLVKQILACVGLNLDDIV